MKQISSGDALRSNVNLLHLLKKLEVTVSKTFQRSAVASLPDMQPGHSSGETTQQGRETQMPGSQKA